MNSVPKNIQPSKDLSRQNPWSTECASYLDKSCFAELHPFLSQYLWSFYDVYHRSGIWDAQMKKKEPRLSSPIGYIVVREEFCS